MKSQSFSSACVIIRSVKSSYVIFYYTAVSAFIVITDVKKNTALNVVLKTAK